MVLVVATSSSAVVGISREGGRGGGRRGGGGGGGRGSDSLVKFCPVFVFFTIRPFPGHPRVNPAPKIGFLGPVGLNSPSRYPKI